MPQPRRVTRARRLPLRGGNIDLEDLLAQGAAGVRGLSQGGIADSLLNPNIDPQAAAQHSLGAYGGFLGGLKSVGQGAGGWARELAGLAQDLQAQAAKQGIHPVIEKTGDWADELRQYAQQVAGPPAPGLTAVVRFNGKYYEDVAHFQAIKKAIADGSVQMNPQGLPMLGVNDSFNLFKTPSGEIITRDEAGSRYGAKRSEELPMQAPQLPDPSSGSTQ